MEFITNAENLQAELKLVVDLFFTENDTVKIIHNIDYTNKILKNCLKIYYNCESYTFEDEKIINIDAKEILEKRLIKQHTKIFLYSVFSKLTNKVLPWGCLTGVRPTKLAYEILQEGEKLNSLSNFLQTKFFVSKPKAELVCEILENQKGIVKDENLIDLYIHIPFCTTRCNYCSFLTGEIEKCSALVPVYMQCLIKEINAVKEIIKENNYSVKTIYVGGGTPTSLSASQLDIILSLVSDYNVSEFTVEAGRPDTITKEKLDVLKKNNVTRISINPQSFNDDVLVNIGRKHTVKDILKCFEMAKPYNFKINMDFIAGLTGDNYNSFCSSIDKAIQLNPDNITVHTLAVKNGSRLKEKEQDNINYELDVSKMVEYAYNKLKQNNYSPYYMYRQKHMLNNLENVGYHKNNSQCIFNIDSMEEICSVVACGAGAISKRVFLNENRIERQPNVKDIRGYIERVDELIDNKKIFFKKQ